MFTYNETPLPGYNSKMTDNWGYYNGINYDNISYSNLYNKRIPVFQCAQAEILKKIKYPTGGYSEFEYEPNKFSKVAEQFPFEIQDSLGVAGGLRIKKIISTPINGTPVSTEFYYLNEDNTDSGILSGIPVYDVLGYKNVSYKYTSKRWLYFFPDFQGTVDYTCGYHCSSQLKLNQLGNTNGNHITYSRVIEKKSDNSKTIYEYTNHTDSIYMDESPTDYDNISNNLLSNSFSSKELERGLLKSVTRYKQNTPINRTDYYYNSNINRYNDFAKSISLVYINADIFRASAIKLFTFYPYIEKKTETTWDENGANPISKSTEYTYNESRQLIGQRTTNSENEIIENKIKYSSDYYGFSNYQSQVHPIELMKQKYMLSYPIEEKTYVNGLLTSANANTYTAWSFANGNVIIKPQAVFKWNARAPITDSEILSNGDGSTKAYTINPLMSQESTFTYYSDGNIKEIYSPRTGITTTYLWSYKGQHPVGEILNATYSQIAEKLGSTFCDVLLASASPSDYQLNVLKALRTNFPTSLVSTYTYNPLEGMTSKTDPRGVVTYYKYDPIFSRLQYIQNMDGQNINQFEYGYNRY